MIIEVLTKRTLLSRLTIALTHFLILNLLLGSMSCDDDGPDSSLCYVTKITDVYLPDPSLVDFMKLTYDNLDRITFAEFKRSSHHCSQTLAEVIWEGDTVRKVIYTQASSTASSTACDDIFTTELTISYANNLVVKIGYDLYPDLYEFSYNNDLTLSESYLQRSCLLFSI